MIEYLNINLELLVPSFIATTLGMIVSWLVVCRQEGIGLITYWREEKYGSLASLFGTIAAYIAAIYIDPDMGELAFFFMGVCCDSLLNKLPVPEKLKKSIEEQEEKIHDQEKLLHSIVAGDTDVLDRLLTKTSDRTNERD